MQLVKRTKLLFNLSKVNLRYTFLAILGLALAISFFTTTFIYADSKRSDLYLSQCEEHLYGEEFVFRFQVDESDNLKNFDDYQSLQQQFNTHIRDEYEVKQLVVEHTQVPMFWSLVDTLYFLNQSGYRRLLSFDFGTEILEDCQLGSSLPTSWNQVFLYSNESQHNYSLGQSINATYSYQMIDYQQRGEYNMSLTIAGIITPQTLQNSSALSYLLHNHKLRHIGGNTYFHNGLTLFTPATLYFNFLENLTACILQNPDARLNLESEVNLNYQFNQSALQRRTVVKQTQNLIQFMRDYHDFRIQHIRIQPSESTKIIFWEFDDLIIRYDNLNSQFLTLSLPVFILVVYLINLSLKVINQQKSKNIVLWRMRGLSRRIVFIIQLLETLLSALIAIFLAFGLGVFLAAFLDTSSDFLTFTNPLSLHKFFITDQTFYYVIFLGFIITLLSNARSIWNLSNNSIADLANTSQRKSMPKKDNFTLSWDVYFLLQGTLGILVLMYMLDLIEGSQQNQMFELLLPLLNLLLIISPLLFIIGIISVFNRFIPYIIHKSSTIFWEKNWRFPSFATRNLAINQRLTKASTLVLAFAMSILLILTVLPGSFHHLATSETYYKLGADVQITVEDPINPELIPKMENLATQLNQVQDIKATAVSNTHAEAPVKFGTGHEANEEIRVIGIPENFAEVAYWQSRFAASSLQKLVDTLYSSTEDHPAILAKDIATNLDHDIGDSYQFSIQETTLNTTTVATAKYWPGSPMSRLSVTSRFRTEYFLIVTKDTLQSFQEQVEFDFRYNYMVLCSTKHVQTQQEIDLFVNNSLNPIIESQGMEALTITTIAQQEFYQNPNNPFDMQLWVISNFNFCLSFLVTIVVFLLYSFTKLERRKKEFALARSLGLKSKQIFVLNLFEAAGIFLLGALPASFISLFALINYENLMVKFGDSILPFTLILNLNAILFVYISLSITILVLGSFMAYWMRKYNISRILKGE